MYSEIRVGWLYRGADLNPDEITAILGVKPTRTWRKGDRRGRATLPIGGWQLGSGLAVDQQLDEHIRALVALLRPIEENAAALAGRYDCMLACSVRSFGGDRPAIHFDADVVDFVAKCGGSIDVDLYVFSEEED